MAGHTLPSGAMVALATPITRDGVLDTDGMKRLVEHVTRGGVRAVCPTGSTGEGPRLSVRQRVTVARLVGELVPEAFPVVAGLPASTLDATREELEELAAGGATAVLVSPPSYYPASDGTVLRLYATLAELTPVPIVLYNIPQFTKTILSPRVVAELAAHPRVIGLKDSSRDLEYLQQVLYAVNGASDFRVLTGSDTLLIASLLAGADGTIAASANLCPELTCGICAAVSDGNLHRAWELQRLLNDIVMACRPGEPPAGWKAALQARGICESTLVPPATGLDNVAERVLTDELGRLGVLRSGHA